MTMQENFSGKDMNIIVSDSIIKIKKLFNHGIQYSSDILTADDEVCKKSFQAFIEPTDLHIKAKNAEMKFQEILSSVMSERQLPQYLHKLLQKQKVETVAILEIYDKIVSQLIDQLNEQDKAYRIRNEKQCMQRELLQKRIENLISELNRIGKEESSAVRNAIVQHTKNVSDEFWQMQQASIDDTSADKPLDSYLWKPPTEMLTFEELKQAFLLSDKEIFVKRKNLLSELCKLRNELEKERVDYILKKEKMERECFEMKEEYKKNIIRLAKMNRKYVILADKKRRLYEELKQINCDINRIHKRQASHFYARHVTKEKDSQINFKIEHFLLVYGIYKIKI